MHWDSENFCFIFKLEYKAEYRHILKMNLDFFQIRKRELNQKISQKLPLDDLRGKSFPLKCVHVHGEIRQ